jgi:putative OPT family oligopeptide transporter
MSETSPDKAGLDPKAVAAAVVEPYRELTFAAVALGIVQGLILNCAFVYAALKLGFSIGGSTVASIMGYALLRGVMRKGTSIENNINQTIASGINTAGTGIVFTLPALFMLDKSLRDSGQGGLDFALGPFLIAGVAGAILGVVVIIPLRKQMIDLDRLRFPSGVAVTSIIRSGSSGVDKFLLLAGGAAVSAIVKLILLNVHIDGWIEHEEFHFAFGIIPEYLSPWISLSLMNVAAGLLAGRGGLPFFVGGALAWWVVSPIAVASGWVPSDPSAQWGFLYFQMLRPLGIGVLIGGALMGVVVSGPAIVSALKSLATATKTAKAGEGAVGGDEMPLWVLIAGTIGAMMLFFAASMMTEGVTVFQAVLCAVVGTVWLGLAALIVAQATGMTDISPMSGMALISVTLMMFILDKNVAGAMVVGVAVCVAIGQGADMMQDLKTGFMLGGRPIKQSLAQFGVTWIGALLSVGVIVLLWKGGAGGEGGFGPFEGSTLPAPQAGALTGIIESVKTGNVPLDKYVMGGVIGALLGAAPMAGLGVLIGLAMYLPFSITLGYGIGCILQMIIQKVKGFAFCEHKLVPLAAGLIVGEALTGVIHALFKIVVGMMGGA